MFHYGWARAPQSLAHKLAVSQEIFHDAGGAGAGRPAAELAWTPLLRRFDGTHPRVAQPWVDARRQVPPPVSRGGGGFRLAHLRLYASDWIERLTGARVFEYRNYVEV